MAGTLSIAWYIVGTPSRIVTWSRAMISSAFTGSKRGISVRHAPWAMEALSPHVCPNEWNSGSAPRTTSSSETSISVFAVTLQFRIRFSCVSSAPFGVPVVPLV